MSSTLEHSLDLSWSFLFCLTLFGRTVVLFGAKRAFGSGGMSKLGMPLAAMNSKSNKLGCFL